MKSSEKRGTARKGEAGVVIAVEAEAEIVTETCGGIAGLETSHHGEIATGMMIARDSRRGDTRTIGTGGMFPGTRETLTARGDVIVIPHRLPVERGTGIGSDRLECTAVYMSTMRHASHGHCPRGEPGRSNSVDEHGAL